MGFAIVALSPDRPEIMVKSLEHPDLGFELYSDASMQAARAFGIAFRLSDADYTRYQGYEIDLEKTSGRDHHELPVPSVFLVEPGGKIGWVYSNPDYTVRPENDALLQAARTLQAGRETSATAP